MQTIKAIVANSVIVVHDFDFWFKRVGLVVLW